MEQGRRLDKERQVCLRRKRLVDIIRDVVLSVHADTRRGIQVREDIGRDIVDEDQVHRLCRRIDPARGLEKVRVGVALQRGVCRVVAVGAKIVGRDVAVGESGGCGLAAGVAVGFVGSRVAGLERREEGIDTGIANFVRDGGAAGGAPLPDGAVGVEAG